MVVSFLKQKNAVKSNFNSILSKINAEEVKMGVYLKTRNFSVAYANTIYKNIATLSYNGLKTALTQCQNFSLTPAEQQLHKFISVNKQNIHSISENVTSYKANRSEKPNLEQTYIKCIDDVKEVITTTQTNLINELTEQEQISKL